MKFEKRICVRLKDDEYDKILRYSEEHNVSTSETVRRAVRLFIYQNSLKNKGKNV